MDKKNKRLILTILAVVLVFFLLFIAGLLFGYAGLGGGEWTQVFHIETWKHIIDFWRS